VSDAAEGAKMAKAVFSKSAARLVSGRVVVTADEGRERGYVTYARHSLSDGSRAEAERTAAALWGTRLAFGAWEELCDGWWGAEVSAAK
jgi:hypothetical protein